jgi:peptidoglycan/LPS O-acetylase OafA/YrhL
MGIELRGSFVVFALLALGGRLRNRTVVYLVLAVCFAWLDFVLVYFVAGVALCDLAVTRDRRPQRVPRTPRDRFGTMVIVAGLFVGGITPLWAMVHLGSSMIPFGLYWSEPLGAVLLIAGVAASATSQRVLNHRIFAFLGRVSFSVPVANRIGAAATGASVEVLGRRSGLLR